MLSVNEKGNIAEIEIAAAAIHLGIPRIPATGRAHAG